MRPVRTITAVVFAAAVAVTGCSAHSTASDPAAAAPSATRPPATPSSTPVTSNPRTTQSSPPISQSPTGPVACQTRQLQRLQRKLGILLPDRTTHPVQLTQPGAPSAGVVGAA